MYRKYTQEQITHAVVNALTFRHALKNLGLTDKGNNRRNLKKYISEYDIDISHFDAETERLKGLKIHAISTQIPLDKILIEHSTYSRTNLKDRLYKLGLKQRECELCGQGEDWMGKRMSLIMDHINGVPDDNRFDNLRIVCPNCNATLDTHCGKQRTKLKPVFDRSAPRIHLRKVKDRPSIEQLKSDISELGYCGTGRKYGVSDNAIRKWLK